LSSTKKRLIGLVLGLLVIVLTSSVLYMFGMSLLEGSPRSFLQSLAWVAETVTTTGYGADARWTHPLMVFFVIVLQFLGVFTIYLVFPIVLIPFLEERFETRVPRRAPKLSGHVIVYRYGHAVETLLSSLSHRGVPYLVIEEDEGAARRALSRGHTVVYCPEEVDALDTVRLEEAQALVANGPDEENASMAIDARQRGFKGDIVAVADEPRSKAPLEASGATAVFTPRHVLAGSLAAHVVGHLSAEHGITQRLGALMNVTELLVRPSCPHLGKTVHDCRAFLGGDVTILGYWAGKNFRPVHEKKHTFQPGTLLVVAGTAEGVGRLADMMRGTPRPPAPGPHIVVGYGVVGRRVTRLLREAHEDVLILEKRHRPGVDVIGDVLDDDLPAKLNLAKARSVILALDSDDVALFATVMLRTRAPSVPLIARANQSRNVERIYAAGADFVLSLSQVAGRMLTRSILGSDSLYVGDGVHIISVPATGLIDRHPDEARLESRTKTHLIAVERGHRLLFTIPPNFTFQDGDSIFLWGRGDPQSRFRSEFPPPDSAHGR